MGTITELSSEITTLGEEIAKLHQELDRATEMRETEKQQNEKTIAEAEEGAKSIADAISVLKQFYEAAGDALLQRYVPPNADRSGSTVGDLAPETFDDSEPYR